MQIRHLHGAEIRSLAFVKVIVVMAVFRESMVNRKGNKISNDDDREQLHNIMYFSEEKNVFHPLASEVSKTLFYEL